MLPAEKYGGSRHRRKIGQLRVQCVKHTTNTKPLVAGYTHIPPATYVFGTPAVHRWKLERVDYDRAHQQIAATKA